MLKVLVFDPSNRETRTRIASILAELSIEVFSYGDRPEIHTNGAQFPTEFDLLIAHANDYSRFKRLQRQAHTVVLYTGARDPHRALRQIREVVAAELAEALNISLTDADQRTAILLPSLTGRRTLSRDEVSRLVDWAQDVTQESGTVSPPSILRPAEENRRKEYLPALLLLCEGYLAAATTRGYDAGAVVQGRLEIGGSDWEQPVTDSLSSLFDEASQPPWWSAIIGDGPRALEGIKREISKPLDPSVKQLFSAISTNSLTPDTVAKALVAIIEELER